MQGHDEVPVVYRGQIGEQCRTGDIDERHCDSGDESQRYECRGTIDEHDSERGDRNPSSTDQKGPFLVHLVHQEFGDTDESESTYELDTRGPDGHIAVDAEIIPDVRHECGRTVQRIIESDVRNDTCDNTENHYSIRPHNYRRNRYRKYNDWGHMCSEIPYRFIGEKAVGSGSDNGMTVSIVIEILPFSYSAEQS